ncbi:hypothetical protein B0H13DRAFT_2083218 [Mycena leptocephala]|nr:hypothetical protein B0H13DRAFT_2083218 [Mycena leptocephala]
MSSTWAPRPSRAHRNGTVLTGISPKFHTLITTVLSRAEVSAPTLLRERPHLCISLEEWALERVFHGALICASKYAIDSTLKNAHWVLCTGVFGNKDVGRIEREFPDVLDWELGVREGDLLAHHEGLVTASRRSAALASRTKGGLKRAAPAYLAAPHPHPITHTATPATPLPSCVSFRKGGKWKDMLRSFPLSRHHGQIRRHGQGAYAIRVAA